MKSEFISGDEKMAERNSAEKKAREYLSSHRVNPEDFKNGENNLEIERDIREVERVKEKDEYKRQNRDVSSVMEAIFLKKAGTFYGKYGVSVKASSEYDDIKGTDAVLQFGEDCFLSVDLTTEMASFEKFQKILKQKTAEVKYFDTKIGSVEMPRAVLYLPASKVMELENTWIQDGESGLDNHPVFIDFIVQAYIQLIVILNDIGEKGLNFEEKKNKALYEKTLHAIEQIWDDVRTKWTKSEGKSIGEHVLHDLNEIQHAGVFISEEERLEYLRRLAA